MKKIIFSLIIVMISFSPLTIKAEEQIDSKIQDDKGVATSPSGEQGLPVDIVKTGGLIDSKFSVGIERAYGEAKYQVGGNYTNLYGRGVANSPFSELSFPIDIVMASANADITVGNRLSLSFCARTGITDDTGDMQDSDWTDSDNPSALTIYSESKTIMDALMFSGKIRYSLYTTDLADLASHTNEKYRLSFWAGVGYTHKQFEFSSSDTYQISTLSSYDVGLVPGQTLTYEVVYTIPYIELAMTLNVDDKTDLNFSAGYSSYANAEDEDNHLKRNMISKADCDGDAIIASFKGRFAITKNWFTGINVDYYSIEAEGESETYVNGSWVETIEEKAECEVTVAGLNFGRRF